MLLTLASLLAVVWSITTACFVAALAVNLLWATHRPPVRLAVRDVIPVRGPVRGPVRRSGR